MMFPSLHYPACFGADPVAVECFKNLCLYAGLKCSKQEENEMSWVDPKTNRNVALKLIVDI